jgi:hypothetical protein
LNQRQNGSTTIYVDNQSVIMVSNNMTKDNRSMYLTNKINFIRELLNNKTINLQYIETANNIADIGTKSLSPIQFKTLSAKLLRGMSTTETT